MALILRLLLNTLALIITAYIVPGFHVADIQTAVLAAIVLGVINTFIKPVLAILALPLTFLTLGLFAFVVNAIVLYLAAWVVRGVTIDNFLAAVLAAIVLSVVGTALAMLGRDLVKTK